MITIKHKFIGHQQVVHSWRMVEFEKLWDVVEYLNEQLEIELMEEIDSAKDLVDKLSDLELCQRLKLLVHDHGDTDSDGEGWAEPEHLGLSIHAVVSVYELHEDDNQLWSCKVIGHFH